MSFFGTIRQKLKSFVQGTRLYSTIRHAAKSWVDDRSMHGFCGQFAEDACLFSYFASKSYFRTKSLDDIGQGFYVDVGAYHPLYISNTRIFYERGWRGINIDPSFAVIGSFNKHRPLDQNVNCAISNKEESTTFFNFGNPSVFSTIDAAMAEQYTKHLGRPPTIEVVEARRLSSLLDELLPKGVPISFLSVDAEGHDLEVLKSNDWERHRPELVVVEFHSHEFNEIGNSEIHAFMTNMHYKVRFWSPPSIIFIDALQEANAR